MTVKGRRIVSDVFQCSNRREAEGARIVLVAHLSYCKTRSCIAYRSDIISYVKPVFS